MARCESGGGVRGPGYSRPAQSPLAPGRRPLPDRLGAEDAARRPARGEGRAFGSLGRGGGRRRAACFVGNSGAGKSTLGALCAANKVARLSDELVAIAPGERGFSASGTPWNVGAPGQATLALIGSLAWAGGSNVEPAPAVDLLRLLVPNTVLPDPSPEGRGRLFPRGLGAAGPGAGGEALLRSRPRRRGGGARRAGGRLTKRLTVIAGPTASGKTALAIRLATALGAEIVSADSQQVYRQFDIGTASPRPASSPRCRTIWSRSSSPTEAFSAGRFQELADAAIADIWARGRQVVVVGAPGCTCGCCCTEWSTRRPPTWPCGCGSSARPSRSVAPRCTPGWPRSTPPPPPASSPPTWCASYAPSRFAS